MAQFILRSYIIYETNKENDKFPFIIIIMKVEIVKQTPDRPSKSISFSG